MNTIPKEIMYAWYILKYHEDFNGDLEDAECMKKIANETGSINLMYYTLRKREVKTLSDSDMTVLQRIFKTYNLYI